MKSLTILLSLAGALVMTTKAEADQLLYLASLQDKTIVAHTVDPQTGKLTARFTTQLPGNPGPMAFSPDHQFVYAAMTGLPNDRAGVATLKRAADGSLALLKTAHITSRAPYIRIDKTGKFLLAAHYAAGDVTVHQITDGICTGELLDQQTTERTAHCIEIDRTGRFAFVPHTAPNKVYQFRLDLETGKLTPNSPPFATGPDIDHQYHEPRHFRLHPKLDIAYTSNENEGGISAWKCDPTTGMLELLQTLSSLPPDSARPDLKGRYAAADLQLTPDGRFAYVSNRDLYERPAGEAPQDTLTGFSLDPQTGLMMLVGFYPTAHHPRATCIDITGRFLYAAGQSSAELFAYTIDPETGVLTHIDTYTTGKTPIWVMCGQVGN